MLCPPIEAHAQAICRLRNLERLTLDIDLRFDPETGDPNPTLRNPYARLPPAPGGHHWIAFLRKVRQVKVIQVRIPKVGDERINPQNWKRNPYMFFAVWLVQRNIAWIRDQSDAECEKTFRDITEIVLYDLCWLPRFS